MNAPSISAPIAHAFDPATWLTDFTALGGAYHLRDNSLGLAIILVNQTDAELSLARMMTASLTATEKTALYHHLRATSANAEGC